MSALSAYEIEILTVAAKVSDLSAECLADLSGVFRALEGLAQGAPAVLGLAVASRKMLEEWADSCGNDRDCRNSVLSGMPRSAGDVLPNNIAMSLANSADLGDWCLKTAEGLFQAAKTLTQDSENMLAVSELGLCMVQDVRDLIGCERETFERKTGGAA